MTFAVRIRQFDQTVEVDMGETILAAALRDNLPYPCGCQSGNCGACKSRLISGEVELSPYSEYALTEDERAAGLILACRAVPWSDAEVAYLEDEDIAMHPLRALDCRVASLEKMTHDIRLLRLEIVAGGPMEFSAGQYASVRLEGLPARDYSMASPPGDAYLEFHIRIVDNGAVSRHVAEKLNIGDRVHVHGPLGIAHLRETHSGPILALAGGSGLAPVKSIVERSLEQRPERPIRLYHGVRDERDVYLEGHFRDLARRHPALSYEVILSEPKGETSRRTGYLADILTQDLGDLDGVKAYLAGPPVMVESCTEQLISLGLDPENCHADAFYTAAEMEAKNNAAQS